MRGLIIASILALTATQTFAYPPQCPPPGTGEVLLPNPADCTTFYKCDNGVLYLMHCPGNLEWNDKISQCDYPKSAQCKETEVEPTWKPTTVSPTTVTGPSTTSKPRPDKCPEVDGPEDVLLPNPSDCGSFFKCLNGEAHLISCPPGQEWSIALNRCDFPWIAQCVPSENPGTSTPSTTKKPPVERPTKCPPENGPEDVLLPNPHDCNSFFKCLDGIPYLIPCPEDQQWSIDLNRCDHPHIAQCKEEESEEDDEYDDKEFIPIVPKPQKSGCPAEDGPEDVLLPNPADCGSFYKCLAGTPVLHKCPPGLHWSTELTRCEYPNIAQCVETESSLKPETTTPSQTSSSKPPVERPDQCPAEDGPEDVLLPNPEDCGSFFKCSGGHPVLIPCPQGLHWSVELNRCDYPAVAKCENKLFMKLLLRDSDCPDHNEGMDIFFPNPKNCTTYYQCSNGVKILKECGVGTLWDAGMQRCDHANVAKCATEEKYFIPMKPRYFAVQENGCPAEDGPEDVLLPNPADCGSFYKCLAGTPVLHKCPPGLQWSTELTRCEYPNIAQCVETESSVKPETTTPSQATSSKPPVERPDHCPAEDGPEDVLLPNPEDCGSFFKCLGGHPELIPCPQGLHWSIELNRCDYPAVAKCENKLFMKLFLRDSDCPDHNEGMDIFFPNPKNCSTYYQCSNGVKILKECGVGTLWDAGMQRCDHANVAKCATEEKYFIPMKPRYFAVQENGCPAEDGPEDVLLPNPADCGSFYKCLAGTPVLHKCPPGLQWSTELTRCEYPNIAQCVETESSLKPETTTPGQATSSKPPVERPDHCPAEDGPEDVLLPNPEDCGSFFKCLGGHPELIPCPQGLHWSIELNRCDYPAVAKCENKFFMKLLLRDSDCPDHNEGMDIFFPNPKNCSTYYQCSNGVKILKECGVGTLWDAGMQRCDHANVAKCATEEKYFIPMKPRYFAVQENGCPAEDGPEDVLLPNPADCGSFYKCLAGTPVLHKCPPGLQWSTELTRCEYPNIAQCVETESSIKPETTTPGQATSSKPPVERPDHCPAEDGPEDVLLPNPEDCGSFFKCLGGHPELILCPPGLHWSVELNRCEYPAVAKCENKFFMKLLLRDSDCPDYNEGMDIFFPNPKDCSTYYQCSNGVKILKECGVGTLWDASMQRCDHANVAKCATEEKYFILK